MRYRSPHLNQNRYHRLAAGLLMASAIGLSACQTSQPIPEITAAPSVESAPLSDSLSSNYLMARHAVYANDLQSATSFFTKSLLYDDNNPALLRHSFLTQYQSGNIAEAAEIARRMEALNMLLPLASEPALIEAALSEDWEAVIALCDLLAQSDTSVILAGVTKSWALLAQDQFSAAITHMGRTAALLENELGLTPAFMELQKAHLLEAGGAHDEALTILNSLRSLNSYSSHIQLSIAAGFYRLGDRQSAFAILDDALSTSFDTIQIKKGFEEGTHHLLAPISVTSGLAQSILDTSWLDFEKSLRSLLLARGHLALIIKDDFDAAHFVIAQEYLNLDQTKGAQTHLDAIGQDSAYYLPKQLIYTNYLRRASRYEEALNYIKDARQAAPWNTRLILVEADILRSLGRHEDSAPLYRALLSTRFENATLHRNLAITLERIGEDDEAERFFLSSLALDPHDPYTLNYLGYWYADTNRNLDKAISYIEKAVEIRPQSGYFADSLGWVHYRLGHYDKAVIWLEKAVQLEPLDPIIIDHLGDAYWRLGRHYEAVYKWRHAAEQNPEDELKTLIDKKLEIAQDPDGDPLSIMPQQ